MNNKFLTSFIIILTAIAIGLSYAIYKQQSGASSDVLFENRFSNPNQGEVQPVSQGQEGEYEGEGSPGVNLLPSAEELGISEDERAALAHPANDAPQEDKQRHLDLVQKLAKEAVFLDITKCTIANPVVFKAKQGEEISVKNMDGVPHTIVFDAQNTHTIPANTTTNITPDFQRGPGTYGYGCDQTPHAAGLFVVTY